MFLSKHYNKEFGGGFKAMTINNQNVIFWNHYQIWQLNLDGLILCQQLDTLDFKVDEKNDSVVIDRVISGGDGNRITIVVSESKKYQNFVLWDDKKKSEIQSFRFETGGRVFHSDNGKTFVKGKDRIQFCDQGCAFKAYPVSTFEKNHPNEIFSFSNGERFDSINHNWILFEEYIGLSFSYMTLVIREQLLKQDQP